MGYESGIKWFLLLTWILAMSPLFPTNSQGSVRLRSFWSQLIFYFLFLLLHANYLITELRFAVAYTPKTPAGYIFILRVLVQIVFQLDFQRVLWTKRDNLGKFIRKLEAQTPIAWPVGLNRFKVELMSVPLCFCNIIIGIIAALLQIMPYFGDNSATQNMMNAYHVQLGKFKLFFSSEFPKLSNFSTLKSDDDILSWSELGFCAFSMIQVGIGTLQTYCAGFFVFVVIMTMWTSVDRFEKLAMKFCDEEVKTSVGSDSSETLFVISAHLPKVTFPKEMRFKDFSEEFKEVQELFTISNDIFGSLILHYIVMSVMVHATTFGIAFLAGDFISMLSEIYPLLLCCTSLLLSANIGTKMIRVKVSLLDVQEDHKLFPLEQFSNLIRRIERKSIAVSAYGCFTVDYGAVFNMITTTMTFFIIMADAVKEELKERSPKKCCDN